MEINLASGNKILFLDGQRIDRGRVKIDNLRGQVPKGGSLWLVFRTKEVVAGEADYFDSLGAAEVALDTIDDVRSQILKLSDQLQIGHESFEFTRTLIFYKIVNPNQPLWKRFFSIFL